MCRSSCDVHNQEIIASYASSYFTHHRFNLNALSHIIDLSRGDAIELSVFTPRLGISVTAPESVGHVVLFPLETTDENFS